MTWKAMTSYTRPLWKIYSTTVFLSNAKLLTAQVIRISGIATGPQCKGDGVGPLSDR